MTTLLMTTSLPSSGATLKLDVAPKLKVPSVFAGKAWQQVLARDAKADGQFVYAVKTTKIFCRPSCPSRRPERKNVTFFPTVELAQAAGYRACLRCEPESVGRKADPQLAAIKAVSSYLTEHAAERTRLKDVAAATGVAPLTILRGFKRVLGVSPREFAKAQRVAQFKNKVREPKTSVTEAMYDAGFGSSSRLYEGVKLGMTPSAMKAGGRGETIRYTIAESPLGPMLVGATARGVCSVAFGEDEAALLAELRKAYKHAGIVRMDRELTREVAAVLGMMSENPVAHDLPLDVRMTAFQQRVWNALLAIPAGRTKTYGELARDIGSEKAARAVGAALGSNTLAVLVPCHRVLGAGDTLVHWRWGKARKQDLLKREGVDVRD